jgi:phosphoribosylamine-glycine ligase
MIQRMGLPIPKWQLINSVSEIEEVWAKYQKPVVIKPTGLTGGHGVVVGIKTVEEAKDAFKFAKKATEDRQREDWQTKIMIQEQVSGEDYRLLVY